MGEEVCDQKQLLRALPPPQMMLPEADPQVRLSAVSSCEQPLIIDERGSTELPGEVEEASLPGLRVAYAFPGSDGTGVSSTVACQQREQHQGESQLHVLGHRSFGLLLGAWPSLW